MEDCVIIKQPGVYVYLDLEETIVKQVNYIKNRKRFSNHGGHLLWYGIILLLQLENFMIKVKD
jgi:hypothetical protein